MIDHIVDERRQPISLNLHRGELRAQRRQTLAQTLAQMFELRVLEV